MLYHSRTPYTNVQHICYNNIRVVIIGVILILFLIREFSRRPLFKFHHAHGRITVKSIKQRLLFVLIHSCVDAPDTPTNIRNKRYAKTFAHIRSDNIMILREKSKPIRILPKNEYWLDCNDGRKN